MTVPASDSILGTPYLDPQGFIDRAASFGAGVAVAGKTATDVLPLVAAASRAVDAYCGRTFLSGEISETHAWDARTRRTKVNQPPVATLVSYHIRFGAGAGNLTEFDAAQVFVSNQENYLELAELALAASPLIASGLFSLGLTEAQVEIVYVSLATVPQQVAAATGFTAAKMANEGYSSAQLPDGLARMKLGGLEMQRRAASDDTDLVPPVAKQLLAGFKRVAIG